METEQIGKITLDYAHYPGEDLYCDGVIEDELLDIVKNYSHVEYPRIIEERANWPILYHLSDLRENIIDWIPMKKTDKVLEIGSGCGAITGAFSRKAGSVTCVELSRKRSMINAYKNAECENVTIHVGNFKDIEPELPNDFDYICLIGVFEYGKSYMGTKNPYEDFLNIIKAHLAPQGRIIIAIENKLGLKYFAGCKEDHLGTYFSGIENYPDGGSVRTFSRRGLEKIFKSCKIPKYCFYYPYPDYKFMTTLYSDAYLPGVGELSNNQRNFDRDRMVLFDEKNAFDSIVEDGLFSVFSNSYIAVLGEGFDVKYAKYSNDRAPEYAISTQICRNKEGVVEVKKYPLTSEANEHIRNMAVAYENLNQKYTGGELSINKCQLYDGENPYVSFEFINGRPLSELMDECLKKDDIEGFHALFRQYIEKIGYNQTIPVSDFDMVFSNILIKEESWTLIDYEWTFGKEIDTKELAFRAIYCYILENEKRDKLNVDLILEELGITEQDAQNFREQEMDFQKFVTGKKRSMAEMRDLIGYRRMVPQKWIEKYNDSEAVEKVQIYEDRGAGYSEENSYFISDAYQGEGLIEFEIPIDADVKMLRIDPAMDSCIVKIEEMTFNGVKVPIDSRKVMITNGKREQNSVVFATKDPNINIRLEGLEKVAKNIFYVSMSIVRIPLTIAEDVAGTGGALWGLGKK